MASLFSTKTARPSRQRAAARLAPWSGRAGAEREPRQPGEDGAQRDAAHRVTRSCIRGSTTAYSRSASSEPIDGSDADHDRARRAAPGSPASGAAFQNSRPMPG